MSYADSTAPAAPSITSTWPATGHNENQPEVRGTAEPFALVGIYSDSGCNDLLGDDPATSLGSFQVVVSVGENSSNTFYADAVDTAGNRSGCTLVAFVYVEDSTAPADRYRLPDGTVFGIISSTTEPFCASCDRSRLTADGMWYLCLYAQTGVDLRGPLRRGASRDELTRLITDTWAGRTDRGAEQRLRLRDRTPLIQIGRLREDPHLEMHTRGG